MSRRLSLFLMTCLALILAWGSVSWYFSQVSQQAFDDYVTQLSEQSHEHFFEVAVDEYQETFLGAEARLTVKFAVPALSELFGELILQAKRLNGPVFINESGVQFGSGRWVLSVDQSADEVLSNTVETLFDGELPQATIRFDFFDKAYFKFNARYIRSSDFSADDLALEGNFVLDKGAYQLQLTSKQNDISLADTSLNIPEMDLAIQRLAQNAGLDARSNAAVVDLNAKNSILSLSRQGKKIPLDISSRGSVWLINDTLSGDWQALFESKPSETSQTLHVELQFWEWLAEGFLAYWRQQAEIASLNEQAGWALDEGAETPEEQDFIMSLYADAERIERAQSRDVLKPMLKYEHSQLALKAQLKDNTGEQLGQMAIEGKADGSQQAPWLAVGGEASLTKHALSDSGASLLERWQQRFWLRRYEAIFEADIAVRNQQFLLNGIRVSLEDLSSELKQLLNDQ